ncbi:MAG: Flp family type IVb pilin [Vicinamibacterales bacterium]
MIDSFLHHVSRIWRDDRGADLVEYGLIAMIIALAGVVVFPSIGVKLGNAFENWGNDVYEAWEPEDPGS